MLCTIHRHQPVKPPRTDRRIGDHYTSQAYGKYIREICKKNDIPHWSPGQLRHNALTRLRADYGLDIAQTIAGHAQANTTEIYAERDWNKAIAIVEKVG